MKKLELQYPQRFSVVSKPFGNTLLVWFCNSGSFILFEQPAADVFKKLQDQIKLGKIIAYLQSKYNYSEAGSAEFVTEIAERCNYYNDNKINNIKLAPSAYNSCELLEIFTGITYKFGNCIISVFYGHKSLYNIIHPLFSHLETGKDKLPDYFLELTEYKKKLLLKCNGRLIEHFKCNEPEFFKGAVLKKIYSLIHGVPDENWMMTLHASGIIRKNEAILFVADSGGGKSTLAALFVAKGYKLLSDDFVVFDTNAMVYPFPAAISVKNTATEKLSEYFPELKDDFGKINSNNDIVRYIPNYFCQIQISYKIKAVVFLNYIRTENFAFTKIAKNKALPQFLKQSWIVPKSEIVDMFLDWFAETTFYTLNYSKFEDVNRVIMQIFHS